MDSVILLLRGGLIGLSVTAPIGPMGVLCINRTLTGGLARGLATGAGAVTVQAAYASALLLSLHQIEPWLDGNSRLLSLGGALLMLGFALRLFWRCGPRLSHRAGRGSLVKAYLSALAINLVNPVLLVMLLGSITLVLGTDPPDPPEAALLLVGLCAGSAAWWLMLNIVTALMRARLNASILDGMNRATAALMVAFSLVTLARSLSG